MAEVGHDQRWWSRARLLSPRSLFRVCLLAAIGYYLVIPLVLRVENAASQLASINPWLTATGFGLQVVALVCYSVMTREALVDARDDISLGRLVRIQLATRAVSSAVPGGAAAGPALGYRLLTSSGVSGPTATAALASGSITSAVVLNLVLWVGLVVSIPLYGFNQVYAAAALTGIVLMLLVAVVIAAIIDGSSLIERPIAYVAERAGKDPADVSGSIRAFGRQFESLLADRRRLWRIALWALVNWALDAISLWVFLRALGVSVSPIGIIVGFGVANILAALPVSPGGIGIVEWAYIPILVAFGATLDQAAVGVACYRVAQFLFPIILGSAAYASLRFTRDTQPVALN